MVDKSVVYLEIWGEIWYSNLILIGKAAVPWPVPRIKS